MRNLFSHSVTLVPLLLLLACSSSEESAQNRDSQPALTKAPARGGTNFTTNQDTLTAAVTKQSKIAGHSTSSADSAGPRAYTIQIGAFLDPQHAVRAQRLAREWFSDHPVFNQFEASLKLYRVSIGKFDARADALALLKEMMKLHPKEYSECWVNTIPR